METVQELFEILKSTPEMALWGLTIWCLFILGKLGSIVYALKFVFTLGINKYHDFRIKQLHLDSKDKEIEFSKKVSELNSRELKIDQYKLDTERQYEFISSLAKRFDKKKIDNVENVELIRLLDAIIGDNVYIHQSTIDTAIKAIKEYKK